MSLLIACDYAGCKTTKLACGPEAPMADYADWIVLKPFQLFSRRDDTFLHGYALCPDHKKMVAPDQWS